MPVSRWCGAWPGEALGGARARWTATVSPTRVRQGGMATVAVFPRVAAIHATNWEFPVPNWRARQVREVERRVEVPGIDEQ